MKATKVLLFQIAMSLVVFGCNVQEQPLQPGGMQKFDATGPGVGGLTATGLSPGGYYSFSWNDGIAAYSDLIGIDTGSGLGTPVWTLSGQNSWVPVPPTLWGPSPVGFAFDVDGSMYTIIGSYYFDPQLARSRLARVDPTTGVLTYIGDPVPMNYCGPDIDSKGNLYVCAMYVPHLGYIHGNGRLHRVDKATGAFTEIGPVNVEVTDWMDLAFDSHDQLWGTTQNKLFKIDTATGNITAVLPILGVPGDPPPPPYTVMQEVMSIAFDANDVLYGTGMNVEWDTGHGSPVMRIDTTTGQATVLGYTEQVYNHGGDIMPTKVKVCHVNGKGRYIPIRIGIESLPDHQAHGDIVPGLNGAGCDCPGSPTGGRVGE